MRRDYERFEFIAIAVALPIFLTVADILILAWVYTEKKSSFAELFHEFFQGFILILLVSFSAASLVRWFRHSQELFAAFHRFEELSNYPMLDSILSDITELSLSIMRKRWPNHASDILLEELESLRTFIQGLNSGKLSNVDSSVAWDQEPLLFLKSRGMVFVTAYGDMDFWNRERGKHMFITNKAAVDPGNPNGCRIVRLFILPPYARWPGVQLPANFSEIIEQQINDGIDVYVVYEKDVNREYRKDVGIFYKDKDGNNIEFVSVWCRDPGDSGDDQVKWHAEWFFDHSEFNNFRRMHHLLIRDDKCKKIESIEKLKEFLNEDNRSSHLIDNDNANP